MNPQYITSFGQNDSSCSKSEKLLV